ncbi:MAG: hypothetical protein OXH57_07355 [Ekhidna sp.]|nr:hypothetical protein [Ekhidna sp.]
MATQELLESFELSKSYGFVKLKRHLGQDIFGRVVAGEHEEVDV